MRKRDYTQKPETKDRESGGSTHRDRRKETHRDTEPERKCNWL